MGRRIFSTVSPMTWRLMGRSPLGKLFREEPRGGTPRPGPWTEEREGGLGMSACPGLVGWLARRGRTYVTQPWPF